MPSSARGGKTDRWSHTCCRR
ncbi:hypothetical protein E2C01_044336 [Portunus trituberculatus]|uniref:Uncharacterized protein n=1 Tax=Portunus trituberculatus TaxID=210409 RepID=A0A5B7FYJ9_PORTR|nr:hypothetical protein [Portunus trituberculatus]